MRTLKLVVVVMGILIVAGIAGLAAIIAGRVSRGSPAPVQQFAAAPIEIPRGARIEALTAGPDRLVVALALPEGGQRLIILDLATGKQLGAIDLRPPP